MLFRLSLQFFSFRSGSVRITAGAPHPLVATWDGRGTNFALFSANAEKVELCLFESHGRREIERIALASEVFVKHAEGAPAKRVIIVPGRLVNVVV